ncbi:MAG: alginate export family protein [Betaproteobacteria bacterium]|nr:alginate export family protein [Betaproteobacteria bacterium]
MTTTVAGSTLTRHIHRMGMALWLAATSLSASADEPALRLDTHPTFADALRNGRFEAQVRPRLNRIHEARKPERADAVTARVIAGWKSAPFHGLRLAAELIHSDRIGPRRFNDNPREVSPYPLLPDPRFSGINQAWVDWSGEFANIRIGRQRLRLDNERFVSDNDFRQVPQMFTGAALRGRLGAEAEWRAGRFTRLRGTRGVESDIKLSFAQAAWNPAPGQALLGYLMWYEPPPGGGQTGATNNAHRVAGARWQGQVKTSGGGSWLYHLEAARQSAHAGGDSVISADYLRVGGGWAAGAARGEWVVRLDHEVKGSNTGRYGLQTPLTDLYAYNGWALQFVTTPREGLRDTWITVKKPLGPVDVFGEVHRFRADAGGANLGRELDLGLIWRVPAWLGDDARLIAQTARYRQPGNDVTKLWVALDWRY